MCDTSWGLLEAWVSCTPFPSSKAELEWGDRLSSRFPKTLIFPVDNPGVPF